MSQDPADSGNLQADEQQFAQDQPDPSGTDGGQAGGGGSSS
jgi:hypothetical protein